MTSDPRSSTDTDVRGALAAWDKVNSSRDCSYVSASRIREALRNTDNHRAIAWASVTCGRVAAYRGYANEAEDFLTDALGRFSLIGDTYGKAMALSHLSITQTTRGSLDRGLELALESLSLNVGLAEDDQSLLYNIAAMCHWQRQEFQAAILYLDKEYELVKRLGDPGRSATTVGNMGTILMDLGEWELSLEACLRAWQIQIDYRKEIAEVQLAHLSNIVCISTTLDRLEFAIGHAKELESLLGSTQDPACWTMFACLSVTYARTGKVNEATNCLERARSLAKDVQTPSCTESLACAAIMLNEARCEYKTAIDSSKHLLAKSAPQVHDSTKRRLAFTLSRCYTALGQTNESLNWQRYGGKIGQANLLSELVSKQIRTNLRRDTPRVSLTEQELSCLSLSANGQTSIDIGLKLGIKPRTVNFHFSKILRKLNAMNRQEAIAKAMSANLLKRL